jgi:hypothetical protein
MDDELLYDSPVKDKETNEDEDDEGLDEIPTDKSNNAKLEKARDWLDRVEQIKDTYAKASHQLQKQLKIEHQKALSSEETDIVDKDDKEGVVIDPDESYSGVTTHMMKVFSHFANSFIFVST